MSLKRHRSEKYQFTLLEASIPYELLSSLSNDKSISYTLNPFEYNEDYLNARTQLYERVLYLAKIHLTKKQYQMLDYSLQGYTQMEIAKKLKVNQSTINKSMNGYVSVATKTHIKGLIQKLQKHCMKDKIVLNLLNVISNSIDYKF